MPKSKPLFWNEPTEVPTPRGVLRFVPSDLILDNPSNWSSRKRVGFGRVIVGFNIEDTPTWTLADLEREWHEFAKEREFPRDVTIVPQRGAYTMRKKGGKVIQEDGATLTVLNTDPIPAGYFNRTIREFGEHIADVFQQEEVIVQVGKGATAHDTWGMRAYTEAELRRMARRRGLRLEGGKP